MTSSDRVGAAFARLADVDRPEVWITLREEIDVRAEVADVDPSLPLAGCLLAVKDNIDVAGLTTTAACPTYARIPEVDAPAVARLRAAGAVVLGKTNLDQFATGLVGTRSPYGAVRDARRPDYISGGSSSGSAVAVALAIVDLALGTDTAGSGRVPAAFQGVVGIKPTLGLIPTRGVVPACRTLDCVTVFAPSIAEAARAIDAMVGLDTSDEPAAARSRPWPPDAPLAAPLVPRLGVPPRSQLAPYLTPDALRAFDAAVTTAVAAPTDIVEIDIVPLLDAAQLLYAGALVAERYAAFGAFAAAHPEAMDPTVAQIVQAAAAPSASALVSDLETLDGYRRRAASLFDAADALLLPTTTRQPTLAEVTADPLGTNARLGVFTNFANLLDLAGVAMPAGGADGGCFGVTLLGPAFSDAALMDLAARVGGCRAPSPPPRGIDLLVVGAHRTGQPLNHELTSGGARCIGQTQTASTYRLYELATEPPKPGLVRARSGGTSIEGELWRMPPARLGDFLAALPPPMTLGSVELADGRKVVGFACEPEALTGAADITAHGSWPAWLAARTDHGDERRCR